MTIDVGYSQLLCRIAEQVTVTESAFNLKVTLQRLQRCLEL
jgi:hypothetical protein